MMTEDVTRGSGNIFADLGVDDADEILAKAQLASAILDVIERRGLTQNQAARILETDQSYISKLKRGRELRRFTFDRLLSWLNKLDHNVTLTIKRKPSNEEAATIHVAAS